MNTRPDPITILRAALASEAQRPLMRALEAHGGGLQLFGAHLWLHHLYGHVFSGPDFFLMARPVSRGASEQELADLACPPAHPDAWYVFEAAGDLRKVMEAMPYPLDYIGFRRGRLARLGGPAGGRVHWHRTAALRRRILFRKTMIGGI